MITVYAVSAATKIRMIEEGLWDAVPANEKSQWSQRFYNNKAAARAARSTDAECRAWIESYIERRKSGVTTARGETAADFLARTSVKEA